MTCLRGPACRNLDRKQFDSSREIRYRVGTSFQDGTMLVGHLLPRSPTSGRLLSLDVFRGIVIAGMILVTDPGTYAHTWHQLRHAEWNGATTTDMIFPAFLFMVGLAIPFSIGSRAELGATRKRSALRIVRRSIALFLLGLGINGFPDYVWNALRLPGILQRIAVCYALCGFLYLSVRERRQRDRTIVFVSVSVFLLACYWAMLKVIEFQASAADTWIHTERSRRSLTAQSSAPTISGSGVSEPMARSPTIRKDFSPHCRLLFQPSLE
jgi:predicted acyltransferase